MATRTSASAESHGELPPWLSRGAVGLGAYLLGLAVAALGVAYAAHEYHTLHREELRTAELEARVLQDHADRTFNTISATLGALDESIRTSARSSDPIRLGPLLSQTLRDMAFLRSLSVIDARGRVLASSTNDNVDVLLDTTRVPLPEPGRNDRLGSLVRGRDLAAAAMPPSAADELPQWFIPMVHTVHEDTEAPLYLVAALNPEYFANQHPLLLADGQRAAALLDMHGLLLSATDPIHLAAGGRVGEHPFFKQFLPAIESGSLIGAGVDGQPVVSAFRTLRSQPMVVLVEHDLQVVHAAFAKVLAWVTAACGLVLLGLALAAGIARRSLRGHEEVHAALAVSHRRVEDNERDLRMLVESVHEMIFRTDSLGRFTFVNGRWANLFAQPAEAVLGRRLPDVCDSADQERVEALLDPMASASVQGTTVRVRTADGVMRILELSLTPIRSADGGLLGHAGFAVDVTERHLAREALEAQAEFTVRLLEVCPTPLFVKDEAGLYTHVNRAWSELIGLSAEAVVGHSTTMLGAEGLRHAEIDRMLLGTEGRTTYECKLRHPDGTMRDLVVSKVAFNHTDGSPAGVIGGIVDATGFRDAQGFAEAARHSTERGGRLAAASVPAARRSADAGF